jgi:predicted alpha-1,2-mannosidase
VYSLWDTYRNEHIFLTLFYPEKEHDMIESLLAMYKENHWLPKWELAGEDAHIMVGDPAPNVFTETYLNGIHNFDVSLAYEAMKHNAIDTVNNPIRPALKEYLSHHYVPSGFRGSVSMTLEYNMADYSIAKLAKILNNEKDYKIFSARSQYYKNLYDSTTGFLRPRNEDGNWYQPFDPDEFKGTGFIEGTAWNYLFSISYDPMGLSKLMGGNSIYVKRLQQAFDGNKVVLYNEPDIAYPYLFTYFKGEDWRTQKAVREGMNGNYNTSPGGLPGNDDCGALSAWYVFSAMGFYPANPLSGNFRFGSPVFSKVILHLNPKYYKGKTFTIKADNAPNDNLFIKSVKLNNAPYHKSYITHNDIENGGTIDFTMSEDH